MTGLGGVEGREFEAGWEAGEAAVTIERSEKVGSHLSDVAHVETSFGQTGEAAVTVE